MNWMTSAKNRVSKGRNKKKDFRLNAHHKLPTTSLRINRTTNDQSRKLTNHMLENPTKYEKIVRVNTNISTDVLLLSNKIGQKRFITQDVANINNLPSPATDPGSDVSWNIVDELEFTPV
jgi:hypothetical protein